MLPALKPLTALYRYLMIQRTHPVDLQTNAMVFAPHADDETLGCGGTIIRKRQAGANVKLVLMTDGTTSHPGLIPADELSRLRMAEFVDAVVCLGVNVEDVFLLKIPEGKLQDCAHEATEKVLGLLQTHHPSEIYITYERDPHPDHLAMRAIVLQAAVRSGLPYIVYEYPVWFWYHWPIIPLQVFPLRVGWSLFKYGIKIGLLMIRDFRYSVDIKSVLNQKKQALEKHRTQMTEFIPEVGWLTLHTVGNGHWLKCFFTDYEVFMRHEIKGNQ